MGIQWKIVTLYFVLRIQIEAFAQENGFISIDCGSQENYTDEMTGINWVMDDEYIKTGTDQLLKTCSAGFPSRALQTVRYFPTATSRTKNCYILPAKERETYLLRAMFHPDNSQVSSFLRFNISVDTTLWITVHMSADTLTKEGILTAQSNNMYFCLINIGEGDPFISSLELRPLKDTIYGELLMGRNFLSLLSRIDCGGSEGQSSLRYPDDRFDRIWLVRNDISSRVFDEINITRVPSVSDPPVSVMHTGWSVQPAVSFQLDQIGLSERDMLNTRETTSFLSILYMLDDFQTPMFTRQSIYFEDRELFPDNRTTNEITFSDVRTMSTPLDFVRSKWEIRSILEGAPAVLNAAEFFSINSLASRTDENDVNALSSIQRQLNFPIVWTGDPCLPVPWDWILCDYSDPPRVIQVLLEKKGLVGDIPVFCDLEKLEILHLEQNNFTGNIPFNLANISYLVALYLNDNNLSGEVPIAFRKPSLKLAIECNPNLQGSNQTGCIARPTNPPSETGKQALWKRVLNSTAFIAVASVLAYFVLIAITVVIYHQTRRDLCPVVDEEEGDTGNRTEDPRAVQNEHTEDDHGSVESDPVRDDNTHDRENRGDSIPEHDGVREDTTAMPTTTNRENEPISMVAPKPIAKDHSA